MRHIITARDQVEMLAPWRTAASAESWAPWKLNNSLDTGNGDMYHMHKAYLENGHSLFVSGPGPEGQWQAHIRHPNTTTPESPPHFKQQTWTPRSRGVNPSGYGSAEGAQQAAEELYLKHFPLGTDTGGHDSGVDYSDLNKFMGEL